MSKEPIFKAKPKFLKEVHNCRLMKQALDVGFLTTNGFGCFVKNADDWNNPFTYCPYCGKRLHKKLNGEKNETNN